MTAQVGLGGGASVGIRMPGLNATNPVFNGRVSFIGDHPSIIGDTNPVGVVEGVTTKNVMASIDACRIGGVISRMYSAAEYEPNGERR